MAADSAVPEAATSGHGRIDGKRADSNTFATAAQLELGAAEEPLTAEVPADWLTVPASIAGILRKSQLELIAQVSGALVDGRRWILVQSPTGSGKTHIIAAVTMAAAAAGMRVLILATRTRIVRQLHERLDTFEVPHGVVAAALRELQWSGAKVQVGSVDTIHRRVIVDERMPLPAADLVIFDEAHLALGDSRVALLERYPQAVHLGFTATPAKVSGRPLRERFDTMVLGPTVRELIARGELVAPRVFSSPVVTEAELKKVSKDSKSGDYAAGELGAVMSRPKLVGDVLENWLRIANGRRTLVFACNKAHGAALVEEFCRSGVAAELLTDENAEGDREDAIARLERGQTLVLVNCFLLSYGTDVPSVECVVLARPTRSVTLYLQCVGRGLRPSPGKDCCLVIDHGRVVETLGLPDGEFAWSLEEGANVNQSARVRAKRARKHSEQRARTCPECSHMWSVPEEGPSCRHCGWTPAPTPKAIASSSAELQEIAAKAEEEKEHSAFFAELRGLALEKGWKQGFAVAKFKERYGRWPRFVWNMQPVMSPSAATRGWVQSRLIAWRKSRGGVMVRAADLHARIGPAWPTVLAQLGVPDTALRIRKAGPCPACGGVDRYTFDNRTKRGDYFCRGCGAGDGFRLLERLHGWSFSEALTRVADAAGIDRNATSERRPVVAREPSEEQAIAQPSQRVLRIRRESCAVVDCPDAIAYLRSRNLWPLPEEGSLRAHPSAEYFDGGLRVGRFPALVAEVRDVDAMLVTVHVTYLQAGAKLAGHEPRKLLSPLTGRQACAVRLTPIDGDVLGIAEGIETALAAHAIHKVPTWAALNTSLLAKFEPPASIKRLVIFADRDAPGLEAASRLAERLQGRVSFEIRPPAAPAKDWNDVRSCDKAAAI